MKKKFESDFGVMGTGFLTSGGLPFCSFHNAMLQRYFAGCKLILTAFDDAKPAIQRLKPLSHKGFA
jgi:hypothetical protein